ncbi:MAG: UDP-glucose/GDP-mannose dehydrogenase family protein [Bdellovibrionaceae bacterium]|nr:UDP-glucose/GDP-mannose dehydrogenase family protein [Pseudobdellovibrionaceae bacterium]
MKISVFGTGYVGLVTGLCFAEMGNDVVCVDVDAAKVKQLSGGVPTIYESGLEGMLKSNLQAQRIQFTTDAAAAIRASDLLFIAVGTPSDEDGSADLKYVLQVAETIGRHMDGRKVVVNKSTVPIGTQKKVKAVIAAELKARGVNFDYDVVSNPEFLREGMAVEDCLKPNRVVVGLETAWAEKLMRQLYEPFLKSGNPILVMDPESSEMTKYAANAMLAAKISVMNEFSRICEKVGADIENVRRGIGTDFRIGPHFIFAGVGYGGSCFPKDVKALIHIGAENDEPTDLLLAVKKVNDEQRKLFLDKVRAACGGSFKGLKIAHWGVAFKPGTDDIREAPALDLIEAYLAEGATEVRVYDPIASEHAMAHFKGHPALTFVPQQYDALEGASALVITTEWKSFREPNFEKLKALMKDPVVCDGRNIYNREVMKEAGIRYVSIGRPSLG